MFTKKPLAQAARGVGAETSGARLMSSVRGAFLRHGHWIDRALGVVFLGFAVSLAVTTLR